MLAVSDYHRRDEEISDFGGLVVGRLCVIDQHYVEFGAWSVGHCEAAVEFTFLDV